MRSSLSLLTLAAALALAGCGSTAKLSVDDGTGPNPQLPDPTSSWFPTVNFARAVGWPKGVTPIAAPGLRVTEYAGGFDHPRWLYVLPNGDVLVAETDAPAPATKKKSGLKSWIQGLVMRRAGAQTTSANRITLLRDANHDGVVDGRHVFLTGLNSPFGMALHDGTLYVANADALVAYPYKDGDTAITAKPRKIVDLPGGPINHHWTKNVVVRDDGRLFVSVGSNSNVGENGLANEKDRAAILEVMPDGRHDVYAFGLRNPVGMAFRPGTEELFAVVQERDEIGSDLVPDYLTSVQPSGFYGWPFSYYGDHVDLRVEQRPDLVVTAIKPDYAMGPHVAVLGLTFAEGAKLGPRFANGVFIGEHGSWNRKPRSGYKVVFVPFAGAKPANVKPIDVLTGFLDKDGHAQGRPVGVTIDKAGGLLVADDVGNRIWRVTTTQPAPAPVAMR
jgi:glucose/arabinose dehydrogenase